MSNSLENAPLSVRFDHLVALLSSDRFLNCEGLGNEVPFFVCPYKPDEAVEKEKVLTQLTNKLEQEGIQILTVNLYDLVIELLQAEGDLEWLLQEEPTMEKREAKEHLQAVLDS